MMHPHPLGYCFKTVPPNVVQLYWEEFQKRCTWDNNRYNSNQVYNAFIKRIRKRYSDFFSEMRSKNVQPKFLSDDVWKAWTTAWNSPEYKRKCMQNKINRRKGDISQPAQATHTGGSISHSEILERQNYLVVYRLHMNYLHSLTRSATTVLLGLILVLNLSRKNMSVQWLSVLRVKETEQ
ncbi:uncharacterized protein [Euphorbia lathyris]|uniref:uncharacterized protein isoform X2 n=1 Tax=Euphorbia lathyris TaxID=212925 RepID=UPI0033131217